MSDNFRLILSDIIRGYTHVISSEYGPFFIKHLNNFDLSEIETIHSDDLEKAISRGIPTIEEKTQFLIKNEIWTRKEELKLKDYKKLLSDYELNMGNEFLKSKRKNWIEEINKLENDIEKLEIKKSTLLGDTAEGFASKRANEEHIVLSFYKDKNFDEKLFPREKFNEFDNKEVSNIISLFKRHNEKFNTENLKRVSILPSFLNMFFLSPDNIYNFYGKPIVELSFYQIDVWSNAKKFQNDINEFPNIPKEIMGDPDKLGEFVDLNRNYKKAFPNADEEDKKGGGVSIVGANKEDLELLGMKPNNKFDLGKELQKKGKLTKEDLLRLQEEM